MEGKERPGRDTEASGGFNIGGQMVDRSLLVLEARRRGLGAGMSGSVPAGCRRGVCGGMGWGWGGGLRCR